jgi:hypothetical protein
VHVPLPTEPLELALASATPPDPLEPLDPLAPLELELPCEPELPLELEVPPDPDPLLDPELSEPLEPPEPLLLPALGLPELPPPDEELNPPGVVGVVPHPVISPKPTTIPRTSSERMDSSFAACAPRAHAPAGQTSVEVGSEARSNRSCNR